MSRERVKRVLTFLLAAFVVTNAGNPNDPCTTPLNGPGVCTMFRSCSALSNLSKQRPFLQESRDLIMNSFCFSKGQKNYVCCPTEVQTEPPTTQKIEDTTQSLQENSPCMTPDHEEGSCTLLRECKPVFSKYQLQPMSEATRSFLVESLCFKRGRAAFMCCPEQQDEEPEPETTTEEEVLETTTDESTDEPWLADLKQKVPRFPVCGNDAQDRIYGGELADIQDFPWTVLLEYEKPENKKGLNCGGSLINERYVLTAAHCVENLPTGNVLVNVVLGEWDTKTEDDCQIFLNGDRTCSPKPLTIKIVKTIVHHNYRALARNKHDDIALLRLAHTVDFTEYVSPICLPLELSRWDKDYTDDSLFASGWGRTENNTSSNQKLKVELPFRKFDECKKLLRTKGTNLNEKQHMCAGTKGRDTCPGDSGGSLMYFDKKSGKPHWYVAGVVSFGAKACGSGFPGVYTKIGNYLEWISDNIE